MEPGNYSVKFMEQMAAQRASFTPDYRLNIDELCAVMGAAQHFILPDGGRMIDVKAAPDYLPMMLRPPFPVTVFEYGESGRAEPGLASSSRRLVLAIDSTGEPPFSRLTPASDVPSHTERGVWLIPTCYYDEPRIWQPPMVAIFLPYDAQIQRPANIPHQILLRTGRTSEQADKMGGLKAHVALLEGASFAQFAAGGGRDPETVLNEMLADSQHEVFAYTQACLCLGCSNVIAEKIPAPEKLNRQRVLSGKRALFDYHVLTVPGSAGGDSLGGGHSGRSVRAHLRRGHIRRISGNRMIWINATMVNAGAAGAVRKGYRVRSGGEKHG